MNLRDERINQMGVWSNHPPRLVKNAIRKYGSVQADPANRLGHARPHPPYTPPKRVDELGPLPDTAACNERGFKGGPRDQPPRFLPRRLSSGEWGIYDFHADRYTLHRSDTQERMINLANKLNKQLTGQ